MDYDNKSANERRKQWLRSAVARTAKYAKKGAQATKKEVERAKTDADIAKSMKDKDAVDTDREDVRLIRRVLKNQRAIYQQVRRNRSGRSAPREQQTQAPERDNGGWGVGMGASASEGSSGDFDWTGWL
jgi:hypothetical protein